MNRRRWVYLSLILAIALAASNLWWLYQALDQASIEKYHEQMLHERLHAMEAAQRSMVSLAADLSREEVIARVEEAAAGDSGETFEKDGWVVVRWVHLKFDASGRLFSVGPSFR
ncbi:MAG: hypothetical protein AAGC60_20850 [Acidobacteriota bacterium]